MSKTTPTAAKPASAYPKDNARLLANRPAHPLNDALITLRAGARGTAMFVGGADVLGGTALRGYVWAVQDERAVVDFGATASGIALRVIANVADLVAVAS